MIQIIKIETKTTIKIIPAAAPATQGLDITNTKTMEHQTIPRAHSRISHPMCK